MSTDSLDRPAIGEPDPLPLDRGRLRPPGLEPGPDTEHDQKRAERWARASARARRKQRQDYCTSLLDVGWSNPQIVSKLCAEFPGLTRAQALDDLRAVQDRHMEESRAELDAQRAKYLGIGWSLFQEMRQIGDLKAAGALLKTLSSIEGLDGSRNSVPGVTGTAELDLVRERLGQLLKDSKVVGRAEASGLKIDD